MADWKGAGTVETPTSGDFETATNWSTGRVPGAGDTAYFGEGSYVVTLSNDIKVSEMIIDGGVELDLNSATITTVFESAEAISNDGTVHLMNGSTIYVKKRFENYYDGQFYGDEYNKSYFVGQFLNYGLVQSSPTVSGYLGFESDNSFDNNNYFENE